MFQIYAGISEDEARSGVGGYDAQRVRGEDDDRVGGAFDDGFGFGDGVVQGVQHVIVTVGDMPDFREGFLGGAQAEIPGGGLSVEHLEKIVDIRACAVFADVQTGLFVLGSHAQGEYGIDESEQGQRQRESDDKSDENAHALDPELLGHAQPRAQRGRIAEDGHGKYAPDPTTQVHRHRAHGVVDVQAREQGFAAQTNRTGYEAYACGCEIVHGVAACGHGHQPAEDAVDEIGDFRSSACQPAKKQIARSSGDTGQYGVHDDTGHGRIECKGGSAVEAEPAQPDQKRAKHGQGQIAGVDFSRGASLGKRPVRGPITISAARASHPPTP